MNFCAKFGDFFGDVPVTEPRRMGQGNRQPDRDEIMAMATVEA